MRGEGVSIAQVALELSWDVTLISVAVFGGSES